MSNLKIIEAREKEIERLKKINARLLESLKRINRIANHTYAIRRNSNKDNEAWLMLGDFAREAIANATKGA